MGTNVFFLFIFKKSINSNPNVYTVTHMCVITQQVNERERTCDLKVNQDPGFELQHHSALRVGPVGQIPSLCYVRMC